MLNIDEEIIMKKNFENIELNIVIFYEEDVIRMSSADNIASMPEEGFPELGDFN